VVFLAREPVHLDLEEGALFGLIDPESSEVEEAPEVLEQIELKVVDVQLLNFAV
jgi:hypothetical protein